MTTAPAARGAKYVFTSNNAGADGRKVTLSYKGVQQVPCRNSSSEVTWATGGQSWGVAVHLDWSSSYDYVCARVRSAAGESGCSAGGTQYCIGGSRYDLSAGTLSRQWTDSSPVAGGAPKIVDVAASGTSTQKFLIADRIGGRWRRQVVGGSEASLTAYEPSQVAAYDATLAVGTDAGTRTGGCGAPTSGTNKVRLLEWSTSTLAERDSATVADRFKPEGVFIRPITPTESCNYEAVAYVADYRGSAGSDGRLYACGIDASAQALDPVDDLTLEDNCHPSKVFWHEPTGHLFVLCQDGERIPDVTLDDACTLGSPTGYDLSNVGSDQMPPTCLSTPSMTGCVGNAGNCAAHDFVWLDEDINRDWLFVTLDQVHQVIVLEAEDPSNQWGFTGTAGVSGFDPLEAEAVSDP